jgi:uncharacterized coiled-coil DUF342 family protein
MASHQVPTRFGSQVWIAKFTCWCLQDELRISKDANRQLEASSCRLVKRASSLELSANGLSQQVAALQHELADATEAFQAALARAEEAEKAAGMSKEQVTALDADCQRLHREVEDLQAQVDAYCLPLLNAV